MPQNRFRIGRQNLHGWMAGTSCAGTSQGRRATENVYVLKVYVPFCSLLMLDCRIRFDFLCNCILHIRSTLGTQRCPCFLQMFGVLKSLQSYLLELLPANCFCKSHLSGGCCFLFAVFVQKHRVFLSPLFGQLWGARGFHLRFPWFSAFPWLP